MKQRNGAKAPPIRALREEMAPEANFTDRMAPTEQINTVTYGAWMHRCVSEAKRLTGWNIHRTGSDRINSPCGRPKVGVDRLADSHTCHIHGCNLELLEDDQDVDRKPNYKARGCDQCMDELEVFQSRLRDVWRDALRQKEDRLVEVGKSMHWLIDISKREAHEINMKCPKHNRRLYHSSQLLRCSACVQEREDCRKITGRAPAIKATVMREINRIKNGSGGDA